MTKLAFVDTETTGLDPDVHEVWEVGLIVREEDGTERNYQWFLPVDLGRADPTALRIGNFHGRHPSGDDLIAISTGASVTGASVTAKRDFARRFAKWTRGAHLVGSVVSFDEERLRRLLRANGACPEWHYHLITVEALAIGYLAGMRHRSERPALKPPWDSEVLSQAVGITPVAFERHTALGDARWARALYDRVMGL